MDGAPDLVELARLSWSGAPVVKKNRQRILRVKGGRRGMIAPSAEWTRYQRAALAQIRWRGPALGSKKQALMVCARYYIPPRSAPDLDNLYSGTVDILQNAGIVSNDYWLGPMHWGCKRVRCPARECRTEVVVYEMRGYRWEM